MNTRLLHILIFSGILLIMTACLSTVSTSSPVPLASNTPTSRAGCGEISSPVTETDSVLRALTPQAATQSTIFPNVTPIPESECAISVNVFTSAGECVEINGQAMAKITFSLLATGGEGPYEYLPSQNFEYVYNPVSGAAFNVEVHTADFLNWYAEIVVEPWPECASQS